MSLDIIKQLDRAKRFVEKGKLDDAIEAYQSVLTAVPNHLESLQSLGDLYARLNRMDRAAVFYGMLFDRLNNPREEPKALALYARFLKPVPQPPERVARFALLLQKQNRVEEAIEQFTTAAREFESSGKGDEALACFERLAQLDPENPSRHVALAELAERLGNTALATRGYLRAGQIDSDDTHALEWFARSHRVAPDDRGAAMLYAQALLRKDHAAQAAALLEPLSSTQRDAAFLRLYADALMRSGQLDQTAAVFLQLTQQGLPPIEPMFQLANEFLRQGADEKAVQLITLIKTNMLAARREAEFAGIVDRLVESHPKSVRLAEFWCAMYSEISREASYFDALTRLFTLYLENDQIPSACEAFEKLVDIDPYDFRTQQLYERLPGRADPAFLDRVTARLRNAATKSEPLPDSEPEGEPAPPLLEEVESDARLEDLLVQAEIFVQYSLQSKAAERLQKIVELFPGEDKRNERLRGLFEAAHWWPQETGDSPAQQPAHHSSDSAAQRTAIYAPDTLRDLAKISEVNQSVFRQPSARAMLSVTANEVGRYLNATRCLALVGNPGQPPQMAAEYCAPGVEASGGSQIVKLITQIERARPNMLGGLFLDSSAPAAAEMGLESVLGVQLSDPETQIAAGMLIVGFAGAHTWRPNETYFLQSIGDQMLLSVHHTRLRSLVRTLAVADEKTGLLARGSYLDCLMHESQRARSQNVPLSLALLQIDHGPDLTRQFGEASVDRYMELVARAVQATVRQTDQPVKYTAWALAVILPDTSLSGARVLADKLRKTASDVPWEGSPAGTSVVVVEADARHEFDNEDIVTDLINRAEFSLEESRAQGGDAVLLARTPKI